MNQIGTRLFVLPLLLILTWACGDPPAFPVRSFDTEKLAPSSSHRVGEFLIRWQAGEAPALSVTHMADPTRVLWQSVPGKSFLTAAAGKEAVHEARGSFFVEDHVGESCSRQSVQKIAPDAATGALVLSGGLACASDRRAEYSLSFTAPEPEQLRFEAEVRSEGGEKLNRVILHYASTADEGFFGFGEQFSFFNMKGKRLPIFVMEQGVGRGAQPITAGADIQADSGGDWHTSYAGVPHYITSKLDSLFLENYEYSVFDLREPDEVQVHVFSDSLRGRILFGRSPVGLIESYTKYAGRMRPLPDWILGGAVIGMQGGTAKVRKALAELEAAGAPLAAFWLQDWEGQRITTFGKQLWWNWELDRDRYPGWNELNAQLGAKGIRTMIYINPFLADVSEKANHRRNLFKEAQAKGYLIKTPAGEPYLILNTSFSAGLIDLSNPAAREWIKQVIQDELIATGARGWMADFGEALPYDAVLHEGTPVDWHNRYPEEWARVNREAIEEAGLGDEIVFFSRSGYTRSPGISTLFWLGDQLVSWDEHDGIKTAVTGLLSGGLSGYAFNHSDIGGYTTITNPIKDYHRSKELFLRWTELSAFNVVFRTHEGNIPEANHQFDSDPETLAHFARFAKVYRAWEFYRRRLVAEAAERGTPVVRHLFLHYPEDPRIQALSHEQFLVGTELLVAPVTDPGADRVEVYFPPGRWVHLWSGTVYDAGTEGRREKIAAPIGKPAVFFKEGGEVGVQFQKNLKSAGLL